MKLLEVFKFELSYRLRRPATYIYFILVTGVSLITLSTKITAQIGAENLVKANSPVIISMAMAMVSALFLVITSAVMGVSVLRDKEHNTESLMYTNPISKLDYLGGRFLGSFVILIMIFSGCLIGGIISPFVPWAPDDLMPYNIWHYIHPFLFIVMTNLFFAGSLFFMSGTLSKKSIVVYTQGIILIALYEMLDGLTQNTETQGLAMLIDPLLLQAIAIETKYWSVAEQNTRLLSLSGGLLMNRVIWVGLGVLSLVVTYLGFKFKIGNSSIIKSKKRDQQIEKPKYTEIPNVIPILKPGAQIIQIVNQARFYFRMVVKDLPFLALVLTTTIMLFFISLDIGQEYGNSNTFPTTYAVIEAIDGAYLFFVIILIFYSGELIWKERTSRFDLIYDATPMQTYVGLLGKLIGMIGVLLVLTFFLILFGVVIQVSRGYYDIDLGLYFSRMFSDSFLKLVLFAVMAFFIQVVVNHKFIGFAVVILFFLTTLILNGIGVEHGMFHYGKPLIGIFSEMNGFGHYIPGFTWFNVYWSALAIVILCTTTLLTIRGSESTRKVRWIHAKLRLSKPLAIVMALSLTSFILVGANIFYNTNVRNNYQSSQQLELHQANYEKTLKPYEFLSQPRIIDVELNVDIYPEHRDYDASGTYILVNSTKDTIPFIHISHKLDQHISLDDVSFSRSTQLVQNFDEFNYSIYKFERPLEPMDTLVINFKSKYRTEGFVYKGSSTDVVFNGTFFDNSHFPQLGYDPEYELVDDKVRAEHGLPPRQRLLSRDDPKALERELQSSNNINFQATLSTSLDQTAVAPGYLVKSWQSEERAFFRYVMDDPIENQYSIISADYEVLRDSVTIRDGKISKNVNLEVYYHSGHAYNIHRMMNSMKKSLTYYSENFSPYQYRQMRILEFPRYDNFAQSFPNTVSFSEGIGFIMDINEEVADIPFYITAHELGHQWWGDQVTGTRTQGIGMLIETLTQYSAAMAYRQAYSDENFNQILLYELNRYLTNRKKEVIEEMPLSQVEDQQYIHYGKGLVAMYALQDYISEDSVNSALRRLIQDWPRTENKFPTTYDLIGYFRDVTPDSLQFLITDLFEKIVIFENKTSSVVYRQTDNGNYEVTMEISSKKVESDGYGATSEVPFTQWVDVGVYTATDDDEVKLEYLEKHKLMNGKNKFTITVTEKPVKAGVDPLNKLIDRMPEDNVKTVKS